MTMQTRLLIFGMLVVATTLEVSGDAVVRSALARASWWPRLALFLLGGVMLFGYGLALNTAPIEFEKVVGIYIAILFIVWQIISFFAFGAVPTVATVVGGTLIVCGGLVVAFWKSN